jgi:hypothetical protein
MKRKLPAGDDAEVPAGFICRLLANATADFIMGFTNRIVLSIAAIGLLQGAVDTFSPLA